MNIAAATIATAIILAALYAGLCLIEPYAPCIGCTGKLRQASAATCKRCYGQGRRLRIGTRIGLRALYRIRAAVSR